MLVGYCTYCRRDELEIANRSAAAIEREDLSKMAGRHPRLI
jgi:hypothetical protein